MNVFSRRRKPGKYYRISIVIVLIYLSAFPKLCYGLSSGQIYDKEAQNIVNTADLVIKAEHAHLQNTGGFTGLINLEQNSPPYLSPMAVYAYNNDECVKKILFLNNIYICVSLQNDTLNVFMPGNFASFNIVVQEISKGITGEAGQISYYNGLADISFNLNNSPPSFASNPDTASTDGSALVSPDANGGMSYVNTENKSSFINKAMQAVIGFFTAILNLF
ncbi:MAG: hypothetical protein M0016_01865 [Deltaproteobacteria bacterium]|nr:hypothetical protein [Deltaproteobacteria bacterium]MCL5879823.1 hypothetical protein [Deltaproteobacteria bacterium]MDA8303894.1 hypothetical protein [Deltaproteobacteria bacterium]